MPQVQIFGVHRFGSSILWIPLFYGTLIFRIVLPIPKIGASITRLSQFTMTDYIVFSICSRQKKQRRRMVKTREITKKAQKAFQIPLRFKVNYFVGGGENPVMRLCVVGFGFTQPCSLSFENGQCSQFPPQHASESLAIKRLYFLT